MDDERFSQKPSRSAHPFAAMLVSILFWLACLSGGVLVLAASAILVGAATPFRYVGF